MVVGFIWNSRGLNRDDKLTRVHDLLHDHHPDFIGLSETKKEDFTPAQLKILDPFDIYEWKWLPANRTAGGILLGVNSDMFDVLSWGVHSFSVSCLIRKKRDTVVWRFITVYGSSYEEHKLDFINELHNLIASWSGPTIVGGDFKLIRDSCERIMEILIKNGPIFSMIGLTNLACWSLKILEENSLGLIIRIIWLWPCWIGSSLLLVGTPCFLQV